jgi:hypothetical protein
MPKVIVATVKNRPISLQITHLPVLEKIIY